MNADETRALIAEAEKHIASTLSSIGADGSSVRAAWARGEGSDERFALVVKLTAALSALTVPDGDARERVMCAIRAGREARQTWWTVTEDVSSAPSDDDFIADAILSDPALPRAAAPEPEWEWGYRGETPIDVHPRKSRESAEGAVKDLTEYWALHGKKFELVRRRPAGPWLPVEGESK